MANRDGWDGTLTAECAGAGGLESQLAIDIQPVPDEAGDTAVPGWAAARVAAGGERNDGPGRGAGLAGDRPGQLLPLPRESAGGELPRVQGGAWGAVSAGLGGCRDGGGHVAPDRGGAEEG